MVLGIVELFLSEWVSNVASYSKQGQHSMTKLLRALTTQVSKTSGDLHSIKSLDNLLKCLIIFRVTHFPYIQLECSSLKFMIAISRSLPDLTCTSVKSLVPSS